MEEVTRKINNFSGLETGFRLISKSENLAFTQNINKLNLGSLNGLKA